MQQRSTSSPQNDLEGGQKSPSILATPTHYGLHYKSSTDTNDHFPDSDSWVLNCLVGTTISTTHQLIMLQSIMILAHLGERLCSVVPCWAKKKILRHIGFVPTITCISIALGEISYVDLVGNINPWISLLNEFFPRLKQRNGKGK